MKKNSLFRAVVLCCMFVAPTLFCACEKNEDETTQKNEPQAQVAAKAALSYSVETSQDFLNLCDVVIKYNDGTGEKTAQATEAKSTINISAALPATFNVKVEATLKQGASLEGIDHVTIIRNIKYSYSLLTADDQVIKGKGGSKTSDHQLAVGSDRFAEYITDGHFNKEITVRIDAEGNLVNE